MLGADGVHPSEPAWGVIMCICDRDALMKMYSMFCCSLGKAELDK